MVLLTKKGMNDIQKYACQPAQLIAAPHQLQLNPPFLGLGLTFKSYFRGFDGNYIAGNLVLTALDSDILRRIKKAVIMSTTLQNA